MTETMESNKGAKKILNFIEKHKTFIPLLLFFASVVFLFAHSHIELNFRTYISENALSPGVVENEFYGEEDLHAYFEKLKTVHASSDNEPLQKYLLKEMESIGLDVGRQNYSLSYPELFGVDRLTGANIYGILRSPGTERTEAVVLSCWIGGGSDSKDLEEDANHAGMALMLALAKSFRRRLYWAKDIVFLFTDMHYIGLQAWLDSYHGTTSPRLITDALPVRSGLIQAALNFEFPFERYRYINLKIEGLNGIMPNLDVINTISVLGQKYGVPLRLHDIKTHTVPNSQTAMTMALHTLARMMITQATGSPNGQHGLFLPYQVPAVTLSAGGRVPRAPERLEATARLVEGVMRSLNNLQERFHQSFFFYLLPRIDRYISIGVYMIPFGGMIAAGLVQAILLWLEISRDYEVLPGSMWWQILPNLFPCVLFGLASYSGSTYFLTSSKLFGVSPPNGLLGGLMALSFSSLFYPWLLRRRTKRKLLSDWRFYKCVILIAQSLMIGCLGVLNISMATLVSMVMVPVALIVRPVERKWLRCLMMVLQLLSHPVSIVIIGCCCRTLLRLESLTVTGLGAAFRQVVLQGFIEQEFLGSWTFRIATVTVFPIWLMFWGLVLS